MFDLTHEFFYDRMHFIQSSRIENASHAFSGVKVVLCFLGEQKTEDEYTLGIEIET